MLFPSVGGYTCVKKHQRYNFFSDYSYGSYKI